MKVLLIDDDPLMLRSLSRILRREDHQVLVATSVEMALETWGRIGLDQTGKDIELIVTDFSLDDGTAADLPFLEEGCPPFILSTGTPERAPDALQKAAFGILTKPYDSNELLELVSKVPQ